MAHSDEPYIDEHPDDARARRLTGRGLFLALMPLLTFGGCTAAIVAEHEDLFMSAFGLWGLSCVGAVVGGFMALKANRLRKSKRSKSVAILAFVMPIVTTVLGFFLGLALIPFQRGRAFRRRGRARLPEASANDHWSATATQPLECDDGEALAAGWRAMGATETASIASFSSLSSQLLAVGAPSRLIELAHRDAIDEIVHARLCYDVARDLDGRALGADAFPAATLPLDRQPTLASLALECLRESCVLEAASAKAAAALAERAADPRIARVLRTIAEDEARHADHGWVMLDWLREALEGDDPGFAAVLGELGRSVPRAVVDHDRFEGSGLAGPALWEHAVREAVADAEARLCGRAAQAA
jgi:hypothetical protein